MSALGQKGDMASGHDGLRPSALLQDWMIDGQFNSEDGALQLVATFTRELDRQNKFEQRPIFAI